MNINKIEQDLLKELQAMPRSGARCRLPGGKVLVIDPTGSVAFVIDALEPFHLSEKCFPFIDRVPITTPVLDGRTRLKPTGLEKFLGTNRTPSVIFDHPDGGKTYLNKKLLGYFDKGAKLYQEFSAVGAKYAAAAVVETNKITGEDVLAGYILPVRPPKPTTENN